MTRKNETSPTASAASPRGAWKAPSVRRLATSAAETGGTLSVDVIEFQS